MSKNPVLVRNISHLTDARYFAAMGVDWMSMELNSDPASFMRWHTLKDWVAGVKLAAEISVNDEMLLAKTIIDAEPDGIIVDQLVDTDLFPSIRLFFDKVSLDASMLSSEDSLILSYDPMMLTKDELLHIPSDKIFLQAAWNTEMLKTLLSAGYTGGICFSGGEEDATGMRDYEVIDELLGMLIGLGD